MQVFRKIAFPISLIYALVVHIRNLLYDWGLFKSVAFATPTICVGNLSVGGTGKTPMVEFLIELLSPQFKIAVLSRGYKRKTKGFLLATNGATAGELGDEPYQLYRKYPNAIIAVDANRRNGIAILEKTKQPDIIILDDAFQHRKVKPDFSLLLTSHDSLYSHDWYLPTGNLRDSKKEAKRADVIIVTKYLDFPSIEEQKEVINTMGPEPHQSVLFATLKYASILIGAAENLVLTSFQNKSVALVTGIANAKPLVNYLNEQGIAFQHFSYADHHDFTDKQVKQFSGFERVITTSKDYTRLEGRLNNLYYIEVEHALSESDKKLLDKLIQRKVRPDYQP